MRNSPTIQPMPSDPSGDALNKAPIASIFSPISPKTLSVEGRAWMFVCEKYSEIGSGVSTHLIRSPISACFLFIGLTKPWYNG